MLIKDNFNLSYDLSGNLIITIPKAYIRNTGQKMLLKSVQRMIDSAIRKEKISESWNEDPAADVVGICKSDADDGSVHHDSDIYGL